MSRLLRPRSRRSPHLRRVAACSLALLCAGSVGTAAQAAKSPKAEKAAKAEATFSWVSPLAPAELAKQPLPATVRHATFRSPSMGRDVGYYIYLPPGYASGRERYPVVYHLHGGRPGGENKSVRLARFVDEAIAAGTIAPTIYVFPNGGPMSWYDMPDRPQSLGETVFVKELLPHIDATYRTWGTRAGRALEGFSQGGRGTTRIMFKYPELFLSVAPGGSGYGPEKRIQENDGYESDTLRFLPVGNNTWDLARTFAARPDRPALSILIWDGTLCYNYADNVRFSAYLKELGLAHDFLAIADVAHTAAGSYAKNGNDVMRHHQRTFAAHRPR
jgi:endo-1,4-beta-xylanase